MEKVEIKIIVGKNGRISIPHTFRVMLGIKDGDVLNVVLDAGEMKIQVIN